MISCRYLTEKWSRGTNRWVPEKWIGHIITRSIYSIYWAHKQDSGMMFTLSEYKCTLLGVLKLFRSEEGKMLKTSSSRSISIFTCILPIILFTIELLYVRDGHWFHYYGLLSTFLLPPIGIVLSIRSYGRNDSKFDLLLIFLNVLAFLYYFIYTFLGYLVLGP